MRKGHLFVIGWLSAVLVTGFVPLSTVSRGADRSSALRAAAKAGLEQHELHWLDDNDYDDDDDDDEQVTLGQSIADGEVVLSLPHVATDEECAALFQAATDAVERRDAPAARGRSRMSVADPAAFGYDSAAVVATSQEILLRVMDYLDANVTSVYDTLFWPRSETWCEWQPLNAAGEEPTVPPLPELADTCPTLRALYTAGALEWSEGEPGKANVTRVFAWE